MINTINNKKKEKKEKTLQAIARAKAWADRRRRKSNESLVPVQGVERKYEVNRVMEDEKRVIMLKSMLKKEKRLLMETKIRIELIEKELKRI